MLRERARYAQEYTVFRRQLDTLRQGARIQPPVPDVQPQPVSVAVEPELPARPTYADCFSQLIGSSNLRAFAATQEATRSRPQPVRPVRLGTQRPMYSGVTTQTPTQREGVLERGFVNR